MAGGRDASGAKDGAEDGVCASAGWSNCNKKIRHFHGQTGADRLLQNEKIFDKINSVTWAKRRSAGRHERRHMNGPDGVHTERPLRHTILLGIYPILFIIFDSISFLQFIV